MAGQIGLQPAQEEGISSIVDPLGSVERNGGSNNEPPVRRLAVERAARAARPARSIAPA